MTHIKEILPGVLIKAAKKQMAEAEFRKSDLGEITENIGKEMPEDKNDSRQPKKD